MAWNAVLALAEDASYGRSYMEHVVALAKDAGAPDDIRADAELLRDTPPLPPDLITLGKPDLRVLEAARRIAAHASARVAALRAPVA